MARVKLTTWMRRGRARVVKKGLIKINQIGNKFIGRYLPNLKNNKFILNIKIIIYLSIYL